MDKNSKWYRDIQILWDVVKKYGNADVSTDEASYSVHSEIKKVANGEGIDKFTSGLLLEFAKEKCREWETKKERQGN